MVFAKLYFLDVSYENNLLSGEQKGFCEGCVQKCFVNAIYESDFTTGECENYFVIGYFLFK